MPYPGLNNALCKVEKQRVLDALDAILSTEKFLSAPQMSAFLRYVVEQTVDGNQDRIKAFTVAVDALGKPETFDPQNDPVVRVLAGRLRASLSNYYDDHPAASPKIQMKRGTYVPFFEMDTGLQPFSTTNLNLDTELSPSEEGTVHSRLPDNVPDSTTGNSLDTNASPSHAGHENNLARPVATAHATAPWLTSLSGSLKKIPVAIIFLVAASVLAGVVYQTRQADSVAANREARHVVTQSLFNNTQFVLGGRTRPEQPAIFISAIDRGNRFQQSLGTAVSGALAESDDVSVHRIMEESKGTTFWPEDYILTLDALTLQTEVRISLQLVNAQTGRLIYSEDVQLTAMAMTELTPDDLCMVLTAARGIIEEDGPLFSDYKRKTANDPAMALKLPVR